MDSRHVRASVSSEGEAVQVSPYGGVATFANEHSRGSFFLAHKPRPGSDIAFAHDSHLRKGWSKGGVGYMFEMQIQFLLKATPRGPIWIAGELREGPLKLNLVTRSLCRVLLGLIKTQAARRGVEFSYSFGDSNTNPYIMFPLLSADRFVFSTSPLPLPVEVDEVTGAWQAIDGKFMPVDKAAVCLDAGTYVTVMLSTAFVDFESWCLANIPAIGTLDLKQFWGTQAAHFMIFDESADSKDRHVYWELKLSSVSGEAEPATQAVADTKTAAAAVLPTKTDEADEDGLQDTLVELVDAPLEASIAALSEPLEEVPDDALSVYTADDDQDPDGQEGSSSEDLPESDDLARQVTDKSMTDTLLQRLDLGCGGGSEPLGDAISFGDAMRDESSGSVSIPWYFCSDGVRDLWWCIDYMGRTCWRHHNQLQELCVALGGHLPRVSANSPLRDLEHSRRVATHLLTQGCIAPGLLEEFTLMELNLSSLLSGEVRPKSQAMFVGIVEAEGRLVERCVRLKGATLRWLARREVSVDLKHADLNLLSILGTDAIKLSTARKNFVFVAKDRRNIVIMGNLLQGVTIDEDDEEDGLSPKGYDISSPNPRDGNTCWSGSGNLGARCTAPVFRMVADCVPAAPTRLRALTDELRDSVSARVPAAPERLTNFIDGVSARVPAAPPLLSNLKAGTSWIRGTATRRPIFPHKDMLMRWPANRIVFNDAEPFLETSPEDPIGFSADLLRSAVAAQGMSESVVRELAIRSGGLKRINLESLNPQDLWGFWLNVFHCLLVHAQLAAGRPNGVQQIVGFYNKVSYLVSGHVFSLVEMEHCILRRHLTKPRMRFANALFLQIWQRTDEDFENRPCLAAPVCSSSCFSCRPDWRLNLVLNAGNHGSADAVPVFVSASEESFEKTVQNAIERTLACCGRSSQTSMELPFNLSRYRDDAPFTSRDEGPERRWARALVPDTAHVFTKISYIQNYGWKMRERLDVIPSTIVAF